MDKNQVGEVEEEELLCAKKRELANICICVYLYKYIKNTHIECVYIYKNCSTHQFSFWNKMLIKCSQI